MSIVGPLVTANKLETRFDRIAFLQLGRLRVLTALFVGALGAGVAMATHVVPSPF